MDWIGRTFTSDHGWNHLERLVDLGNRMAGSEGERAAAELTREALDNAGARDAHIEEFGIQGWTRGESHIEAVGTEQECIALPRSPSGTISGELVDLGHGIPEDFETNLAGKIVMVASDVPPTYDRFLHRREKYYHAVEAGAAAFVFRNHIEGCLAPTGSVGTKEAPIGEIPAVGVSKEVGKRLARRFDGEDVTVHVDADIHDAESGNVHAELGPDTDERLLLTAHVDAHDISEGAMDNGAGTAACVEIANALAAREDELDTKVEVIVYGAEEVGLRGSTHHAAEADLDDIRAVVNLDGICRERTLSFATHHFDELGTAARQLGERFDHPVEVKPELSPHSDHWSYTKWGVPSYHVSSKTGEDRGWGHTRADTLDKLEPRDLRESAILLTDLVVDLAGEAVEIPRKSESRLAELLEDEGLAEGMKITGEWPY